MACSASSDFLLFSLYIQRPQLGVQKAKFVPWHYICPWLSSKGDLERELRFGQVGQYPSFPLCNLMVRLYVFLVLTLRYAVGDCVRLHA